MLKKIIIAISVALLFCSCVTLVPVKTVSYNGDLPIYPAVVKVFADRQAKINKIDVFNEEFYSDFIYAKDLLLDIRFKLFVKNKNGTIETQLIEMEEKEAKYDIWNKDSVTLFFDKNKYANNISTEIAKILSTPNEYDQIKSEVLSNFAFNYLILKDLTDVGREHWVDKNMKGRIYDLNLALKNFEHNKNKDIKKDYIANFAYNSDGFLADFSIDLYTNNERYATMKKNSVVKTKGSLLEAKAFLLPGTNSFTASLVEKN